MDNKINGVVFDVDGVLIHSLDNMKYSWGKVCEHFSINVPFSSYQEHIGKPFEVIMQYLKLDHLLPEIKEIYFYNSKNSGITPKVYPGVEDTLSYLKSSKFELGVVTSKTRSSLMKVFEDTGLIQYFTEDLIYSPPEENPTLGKPNPFLGSEFIKSVGLKVQNILYIGDMESDYQFANNVGFNYCHHTKGYGGPLEGSNIISIDSIDEIKKLCK